ncbi:IclR family transcriptional regulator [Streptomyces sioyaensis]|uniref:IclR family transcriptional regulator n=1 Tax=Streptomyces sioyaensis TaxID=67364 RepID=UPI0037D41A32
MPSSVAGKLFAILDCFTAERQVVRLTDISALSGIPLSTVHRMCADLEERGALERGPDGTWSVGSRLWQIGNASRRAALLRDAAMPVLSDLHARTLQSVHVATRSGLAARYVMEIGGSRSAPVLPRIGSLIPLHATASGKVLLAYAPPELQEQVLAAGLPARTQYTLAQPGRLRLALAEVRKAGVGYVREEFTLGVVAVSAPVFHQGSNVAALTIVARTGVRIEQWESLLRQGAKALSQRLAAAVATAADLAAGHTVSRSRVPT